MPSKKILLIDNDVEYQALITNALEPANYRINMSLDGESGFQLAKKDRPDLVIIAIELQDSNGYLISKKFREDEGMKNIPIILISRDAKPKDFEQHRKLKIRADEYLLKPFSEDVLLSKVQNLIGFHISEKEFELMQEHLNSMIQEKILLDDRINMLEKENEELKSKLEGIGDVQRALRESKEKEAALIKQLNESKEHTKVIDKWLTEANDTKERLQKDNDKLTRENASVKTDLENFRKQVKELETAFNVLQNKVKSNSSNAEKIKNLLSQVMTMLPKE
jgi:DNA-binding response OmpR family regulator